MSLASPRLRPRLRPVISSPPGFARLAGGVDVSHPATAVAVLFVLTAIPYLYPFQTIDFPAIWSQGAHLGFVALFFALNAGVVLAGAAPVERGGGGRLPAAPAWPPKMPARPRVAAGPLLGLARGVLWVSLAANVGLLAYALPRYQGSLFSLKEARDAVEGVGALTQAHLFFLGPFLLLSIAAGRPYWRTLAALGVVLAARAGLTLERVALFEFLVPVGIILVRFGVVRVTLGRSLVATAFLPAFFIVTEMFRSFHSKFVGAAGWSGLDVGFALTWNLERFFAYYADTTNKLYFVIDRSLFMTTTGWSDAALRIAARLGLAPATAGNSVDMLGIADVFGARTPEMNNPGGLALLATDFGWGAVPVYALALAALLVADQRLGRTAAAHASPLAAAFYPVLFLTFLELPRYVYLYETRALFPLLLFLAGYGLCHASGKGTGVVWPRPRRERT